jgi:hypothetical protein
MLFQAVMKLLSRFVQIKILVIRLKVHWYLEISSSYSSCCSSFVIFTIENIALHNMNQESWISYFVPLMLVRHLVSKFVFWDCNVFWDCCCQMKRLLPNVRSLSNDKILVQCSSKLLSNAFLLLNLFWYCHQMFCSCHKIVRPNSQMMPNHCQIVWHKCYKIIVKMFHLILTHIHRHRKALENQ